MGVTLSIEDRTYIAQITGYDCRAYAWQYLQIYGLKALYSTSGGNKVSNELWSSEEEEILLERDMQYLDDKWKERRQQIIKDRKVCEHCYSRDSLQVHHIRYLPDRPIWDYEDVHLKLLCRKCHEFEHNIRDPMQALE